MNSPEARALSRPAIDVTFYFGSHDKLDDANKFQHLLEVADVYIPEIRGWTDGSYSRFNNVAQGIETPGEANQLCIDEGAGARDPFTRRVWEMLYDSKKQINFVDVPHGFESESPATDKLIDYSQDFIPFLHKFKDSIVENAQKQDIREEYIYGQLKDYLMDSSSTEQVDGRSPKVLLNFGAVHTRLFHKAVRDPDMKHVNFEREFGEKPQKYFYFAWAVRQVLFDKRLDDKLLSQAYLEAIFMDEAESVYHTTDSDKDLSFMKCLVEPFTFEDVEKVYRDWSTWKTRLFIADQARVMMGAEQFDYTNTTSEVTK